MKFRVLVLILIAIVFASQAALAAPAKYYCPMHTTYTSDKPGDCPICHMRLVLMEASTVPVAVTDPKEICILHNCPMEKNGQLCPMMVIAQKGEKIDCPFCKIHLENEPGMTTEKLPAGYATVLISPQKQQMIGIRTAPVGLRKTAIMVPAQAVFFTGTENIVFVDRGNNLFEPQEITLGERLKDLYVVKSGLKEGDRVVINGNFLLHSESRLKAALTNSGGSGGHQHG